MGNTAMMRAVRAESFTGYKGLRLVEAPRPRQADGRALVRITATVCWWTAASPSK